MPPNCREKNFEHGYYQVANFHSGTFIKITITVTKVVLIQVFFLTVSSKDKKIKIETRNIMAPSCHSKLALLEKDSPIFLLFRSWSLVLSLHFWVKSKLFQ